MDDLITLERRERDAYLDLLNATEAVARAQDHLETARTSHREADSALLGARMRAEMWS